MRRILAPVAVFVLALTLAAPALAKRPPAPAMSLAPKEFCDRIESQDAKKRQQCLDLLMAGVDDKRIKYNKQSAAVCVAKYLKKENTEGIQPARADCERAVQGQAAKGAACDAGLYCQAGLACVGKTGGAPGVCTAPLKKGAPCDDAPLNDSFLVKILTEAHPVCEKGTACKPSKEGALTCR